MSEYIPHWVWAIFGLGSPIQELLNRWVPDRLRSVSLWGVAAGIVAVTIWLTPLKIEAFDLQIALVYAALTSGWAMSDLVKPPVKVPTAALRAFVIVAGLGALAFAFRAHAQVDSTVVELAPAGQSPARIFTSVGGFFAAQLISFLGSVLVRWLGKAREGSLRAK